MRKDGFMKSGIYRVLDYIARLVILNVLILIISFLLLLIFIYRTCNKFNI